jgi:hypothetical protein
MVPRFMKILETGLAPNPVTHVQAADTADDPRLANNTKPTINIFISLFLISIALSG